MGCETKEEKGRLVFDDVGSTWEIVNKIVESFSVFLQDGAGVYLV